MEVIQKKNGDVIVMQVTGKLDSNTSGEFEKEIIGLINKGENKFLIDGSRLDYISSAGLRVLLFSAKKLKASGGRIVLSSLKDHIREVFDIAGFSSIFPIYESSEAAEQNF